MLNIWKICKIGEEKTFLRNAKVIKNEKRIFETRKNDILFRN